MKHASPHGVLALSGEKRMYREAASGWSYSTRSERGAITYVASFNKDGKFIIQREWWPSARRSSHTNFFTAAEIVDMEAELKELIKTTPL